MLITFSVDFYETQLISQHFVQYRIMFKYYIYHIIWMKKNTSNRDNMYNIK